MPSSKRPPRRSPTAAKGSAAPGSGLTIGVDMGGTKIALAVVSEDGRILASHRHPTDTAGSIDQVISTIASCVQTCLGDPASEASALGMGIAAQLRERDGVLLEAPNLPWRNVPLRAKLEKAVGLPSTVTNDVRAATLGEWRFGAGRGEKDIVCVFVGTGVGGGLVADGRLRYGPSDTAGEVGHLTIVSGGRACHCRNNGCLEAYAGGWAIAERTRELARAHPNESARLRSLAGSLERITAETVAQAYRGGDPFSQGILESTIEYLADGLVGIVNAINPKVLILGGGVIDGLPNLVRATEALVRQRALPAAVAPLSIVRAGLGEDAGVMGAAEAARSALARGANA